MTAVPPALARYSIHRIVAISAASLWLQDRRKARDFCAWGRTGLQEKVGSVLVRILVVDDNPTVRHYLRAILEQHSAWRVWEARTGEEALNQIRSSPPDLVVLDFRMPDLNGLEIAREIGRDHPGTPILMVTVYLSSELAAAAKAAGIRGACAKSDIGSLVQAAEAVLRKETYFPTTRAQDGVAM